MIHVAGGSAPYLFGQFAHIGAASTKMHSLFKHSLLHGLKIPNGNQNESHNLGEEHVLEIGTLHALWLCTCRDDILVDIGYHHDRYETITAEG